jgi:hypothetical protein
MATLVERHSRYVMLIKLDSKRTETVVAALIKQAHKLPRELYKLADFPVGHGHRRRGRVEFTQSFHQSIGFFLPAQIGFGNQHAVGYRRLLDGLFMPEQGTAAIDGIHSGYDGVQAVAYNYGNAHQGVQDRGRIGQSRGLDHHALERRNFTFQPADRKVAQGIHQVTPHGAAKAA